MRHNDYHVYIKILSRYILIFLFHQTYIQRNKTQVVDVDSSGRPCKERLLSVLHIGDHPVMLTEFNTCDFKNITDLKEWMMDAKLVNIYESVIAPVVLKK